MRNAKSLDMKTEHGNEQATKSYITNLANFAKLEVLLILANSNFTTDFSPPKMLKYLVLSKKYCECTFLYYSRSVLQTRL